MSSIPVLNVESSLDEPRRAVIYRLRGKLIGGKESFEFLEMARARIQEGAANVILDLSETGFVNSTGIGIFAALFTSTQKVAGKLYLVGVTDKLQRTLEAVYIWSYVQHARSLEDLPAEL